MHRAFALLVLVLSAGCGGRHEDVYPPEVVRNFLASCEERHDARGCRCALDILQARFTLEEFNAFEARMRRGDVPKELVDAVAGCR
jgi:hypothetical protein